VSAPTAPRKRKGRALTDPALFTPPSALPDSTADPRQFDFDQRVVDQVDASIWRALFLGQFRLAVRCDICGRWLTAGRSKAQHRGPRCAAKVGA
jgi:hypothetical protein